MATLAAPSAADTLLEALARAVGPDQLLTDEAERRFHATDVFSARELPVAVVRPGSVEELQAVVRACAGARAPVTVRGGGASYTEGYLHHRPGGVTIDTSRLTRIDVDEANALVTVEPGVTWARLREALHPRGLRTPFWGPFSGLAATVGGSVSQHAISHGTGAYGVSAESVVTLDIVTGTGDILSTGTAGSATPTRHFRHFGPDLVGLFTGDCGALGIKARITLRLLRQREAFEAASFSFPNFAAMHAAMRAVALEHVDEENFGLDATLQQGQLGRQGSAGAKAGIAKAVLKSSGSLGAGVKSLARMATAGSRALAEANYVVHYIVEGVDQADARARVGLLKRLAVEHGTEIPNTVPTVVRSMPFAPLTNVLGPKGERWVPLHGLFAHEQVIPFHEAYHAYLDTRRADMDAHGLYAGAMFMSVGPSAFVYEPALYWPDARSDYHDRVVPADHLRSLPTHAASAEAYGLAETLKREIADLMAEHGAAHLQVGKFYPYLRGRNAPAVALLRAIKRELDPHDIMNPGALGL